LLDFGVAKILDPEAPGASTLTHFVRAMTPDYASPEQVRGEPVTPATAVYALGLLLYELLTGRRPYNLAARTTEEIARIICEQDPPRPSAVVVDRRLPRALDAIVLKALRKEPSERYPTVTAFADDLRRYLSDRPVAAGRDALRYRGAPAVRRRRGTRGGAGR